MLQVYYIYQNTLIINIINRNKIEQIKRSTRINILEKEMSTGYIITDELETMSVLYNTLAIKMCITTVYNVVLPQTLKSLI